MSGSVNDDSAEQARQAHLVQDAFARGQAALVAGDKVEAVRWLDRAQRLAPGDGTITLVLASAMIGDDNPKAVELFAQVLESAEVRDARLGLATVKFLMGDLTGARDAVAETLGRHMSWPDLTGLADQVGRATDAPGWCGLSGEGVLIVRRDARDPVDVRMDGRPLPDDLVLPPAWPRARTITATVTGRDGAECHLIGSPISLQAIGRVEGHVEATESGIRGWAWHPGDPDTDPRLTIGMGRARKDIIATGPAISIPGLPPLARPRSFAIPWANLPGEGLPVHLRGRDGRELSGSPVGRRDAITPAPDTDSLQTGLVTRRRQDLALWRDGTTEAIVMVTHNDGGGVERRVLASVAAHESVGRQAIVLRPTKLPNGSVGVMVGSGSRPDLRFELPRERAALLRLLRATNPVAAELHHFLNHDPSVFEIIRALGVPYEAHAHDYAWFCPRIALVGRNDRYCGEPAPSVCETCVETLGGYLHEDIRVADLVDRSQGVLSGAGRIVAPSYDAAARLARHFRDIAPVVVPHEDDAAMDEPPPTRRVDGQVRICVAGAIGLHKGFHVLLACARDAKKRALDLTFVVVGTTIDDQRLIDTGRVFVTGPYRPDEAVALIRAQEAALALLPSIWPETWCLGLTELWRAGLRVAAFDIGAPAERIRQTGRGVLLPLGLPPPAINDALLNATRGRSLLPIRHSSAYKPSHQCNPE